MSSMWDFWLAEVLASNLGYSICQLFLLQKNMRFHLFSKIRALSVAFRASHILFPSLCTPRPHLPRQMSSHVPFVPAAEEAALVATLSGCSSVARIQSQEVSQPLSPDFGSPRAALGCKLSDIWPAKKGGADGSESAPSQGRHRHIGLSFLNYAITNGFPSQPLNNVQIKLLTLHKRCVLQKLHLWFS